MALFHSVFITRPLWHSLKLALFALLLVSLSGCGLDRYVPSWPGSGGGGRPAGQRRAARTPRAPSQAPQTKPSPPLVAEYTGPAVFNALGADDAERLALRLSPASQSLHSFRDLESSLRVSLEYAARQPQRQAALVRPAGSLTWGQVTKTLRDLLSVLPRLDAEPELLSQNFVWYELAPNPLLTGYYSPEMDASPVRTPGYEYPLYAAPDDLKNGARNYDRRSIDLDGALAGRGLELAWLPNPADPFLLQTEGGGVLRFPDGRTQGVHFAGTNGMEFNGLGQILLDSGVLPKERLSRENIRQWCAQNSAQAMELMTKNRSYVFFRFTAAAGEGSLGKPLTPLVSLATDPSLLPMGAVAALDVPLPSSSGPLRGLVLAQDTGADIRGLRLDLFLGGGAQAERLVSSLRTPAALHLLVSKSALRAKVNE